jgi:selenocysteine lyase/cysteine desulfurase
MPAPVITAIEEHVALESRMGGYEAEDERAAAIAQSYASIGTLINAAAHNIAVTSSATMSFIQALSAFDFAAGDVILTSRCDYTSNQLHYLSLAKRRGVRIVRAEDLSEGGVDPESVRRLAQRDRPRLVAMTWVPTNSGLVQDVGGVGMICADLDIPYVIDGCQAVGQLPVDVAQLHCDYFAATARKFLRGPRGIGFLYVSDRAIRRGDYPLYVDMRGATWTAPDEFVLAPDARRFEDWEFPYALVLGLGAAARYALTVGVDQAAARARALARRVRELLAQHEGMRLLDRGTDPCAIVTVDARGHDASALVSALRRRRINASASLRWYGMIDMTEKGVESALRLSPHYYNTLGELDVAVSAIDEITAR